MKDKARVLRRNQTDAERVLWQLIRGKRMNNLKFRRQHPISPYIVDFICTEKKLIIEIDGGQHADTVEYDNKRTTFLESKGYTVIRFWNNEVLNNFEGVYEIILKKYQTSPLSPAGGGLGRGEKPPALAKKQGE